MVQGNVPTYRAFEVLSYPSSIEVVIDASAEFPAGFTYKKGSTGTLDEVYYPQSLTAYVMFGPPIDVVR